MKKQVIEWAKTIGGAALIFALLKFSGLLPAVSYVTQSAVIYSGLVNADNEELTLQEDFNYNFSVKELNGSRVSFDQFRGKVVFLNLWATWCGPCRAEMASIQKLYDKIDKTNIQFVLLSIDKDQDLPKVNRYIAEKSFTFPVFMPTGKLTEQMDVPSIPTTFIISKDGKIVSKEVGTTNFDTARFKKFIEDLAAQ
jgi:thiol-disulfide isomerase/thioredoxin